MIRITTKYKSRCAACGKDIGEGVTVNYEAGAKRVYHIVCGEEDHQPAPADAEALAEQLGFEKVD